MRITDKHEAFYREHGYAIVENFCTPSELQDALQNFDKVMPGWVDFANNPSGPKPRYYDKPFPDQRGIPHFPYPENALNDLTFHPELRRFATLMGDGEEMYCEQSHLSYKASGQRDFEQAMHMDYSNHSLAYPPDVPKYWQTAYLYYFTDVTLESGPTAVCSKQHYPERILVPPYHTRESRPEIYDHEVKVTCPAGSLLIYGMRTFHRGTAITGDNHGRLGMFVTYAPKACRWMGIVGWPVSAGKREFRDWIEQASVEDRTAIGFPEPGHDYWTQETLDGVAGRYPGMDMTPYEMQK
ncbi:MAG: phytanoyl-CoA dioxygenase family protein [Pseudomonadales bacterium]|nr:phytanoyl-CoA dioxygenase family protein [Pseudomonadales bacterium]